MMASRRSPDANGADAVGDAFQLLAQGLAQLQEALRVQKQEAERGIQEAEERMQEALRLQEERAAAALRDMERKLQEKDDAIRGLQQRLEETQQRLTAMEERTTAPEGSGGEGGVQLLECRMNEVEASLQSALQKFMPRVEALLKKVKEPRSARASLATSAASVREAPATGGAAAGGREEPSSPTPTCSGAGHQGAAADEDERARQRVERRVREAELRRERARTSPSPLGEQLCKAAFEGGLSEVRRLIDSGADVNYTKSFGSTPLIDAAYNEHADVVSLLLQRGADVNSVDCDGWSALHCAAWHDLSGRCVELLLRAGADVDARNTNGATPLHCAVWSNNEEAVRALLAAGTGRDLKPWGGPWKDNTPFDLANSSGIQDLLRCSRQE